MNKQDFLGFQKFLMQLGSKYQFTSDEEETIYFWFNHRLDELSLNEFLTTKKLKENIK